MLRIGITARRVAAEPAARGARRKTQWAVEESLADAVLAAGAWPVPLLPPPCRDDALADAMLATTDALVLQGGGDVDAALYGGDRTSMIGPVDSRRDRFELTLLAQARRRHLPVLGVCRGMHLINVACGGSLRLAADIAGRDDDRRSVHSDPERYDAHLHDVAFEPSGWLSRLYGGAGGRVVSVHRYVVDRVGGGLRVDARCADDGAAEALVGAGDAFLGAVQWHPEYHADRDGYLPAAPLFAALCEAARR